MTTFLLIRHGETDAVGKILAGRKTGVRLNPSGKEQVERLAQTLSRLRIDALYTSPLERAIETAEAIGRRALLMPAILADLNEVQFGDWEGLAFQELAAKEEWRRFNSDRRNFAPPGGESMREVQRRMAAQLETLRLRHDGQTVVAVSHCDPLRALIAHWLGLPIECMLRFEVNPGSVTVARAGSSSAQIVCLNRTEELGI